MDKSFEGLLISVLIHFAMAMVLIYAKLPTSQDNRPIQVELVEKERPDPKKQQFAPVHERQPDRAEPPIDPNDQAHFLSDFTKRVKKQLQAKQRSFLDQNADARRAQRQADESKKHLAGLKSEERGETGKFERRQQEMTSVTSGVSSVSEPIPGVEFANVTTLNTDRDLYYIFYERSGTQLVNRWGPAIRNYLMVLTPKLLEDLAQRNRLTKVEALLTPEGQLFSVKVIESCGDKGLDELTLQAFREAGSFPHPPHQMVRSDGFIHYYMAFEVLFRPPSFGLGGN